MKAYTHAIDARPDHALAKFQRGVVAWKLKDAKAARRDLTEYLAHDTDSYAAGQARIVLAQLPADK